MTVLGVIGDAIQLAISGTTGIGSLAGSLLNTGYNIVSGTRAYEADRADTAWNQQMQEKQRQDSLTQQRYENEASERAYQDAREAAGLQQQRYLGKAEHCQGRVGAQAVNAQAKASRAAGNAAAKSSGSGKGIGERCGNDRRHRGNECAEGQQRGALYGGTAAQPWQEDTSIANALQKEGYTTSEIAKILQQMNQ